MKDNTLKSLAIIGGGLTGWTAALALAKSLNNMPISITLVDHNPTSGELPWLLPRSVNFHQQMGFDEKELMKNTDATFSLGTQYFDWQRTGHEYFQPHGPHGSVISFLDFHHYVIKAKTMGQDISYGDYAFATLAAKAGKFVHPQPDPKSLLSVLNYSANLDPAKYLQLIQNKAKELGVISVEGAIQTIDTDAKSENIQSVKLANDQSIKADFYFDCTGSEALLIQEKLASEYQVWKDLLPFNKKVVVKNNRDNSQLPPFTTIKKRPQGFSRSYMTQNLEYSEIVFDANQLSEEDVQKSLDGQLVASSSIHPGQRKEHWKGNCLALGQSAADFCAVEVSNLQTVQDGILRFIELFPNKDSLQSLAFEYNRITQLSLDNIRDYISLHFIKPSQATSKMTNNIAVSDSLVRKIKLFKVSGKIAFLEEETFAHNLWASAFLGLEIYPESYDPFIDAFDFDGLNKHYSNMLTSLKQATAQLPSHQEYLLGGLA